MVFAIVIPFGFFFSVPYLKMDFFPINDKSSIRQIES